MANLNDNEWFNLLKTRHNIEHAYMNKDNDVLNIGAKREKTLVAIAGDLARVGLKLNGKISQPTPFLNCFTASFVRI